MADSKPQDTKQSQKQLNGAKAVVRESVHGADDAVRRGAEAVEQGSRAASDAMRQGGEMARQGTHTLAEAHREFIRGAAEQFDDTGRKVMRAMQQATEDLCALMAMPSGAGGGLQDLQQGMAGLVESVIMTNLQATQELFRLANPGAIVELQRRFTRDYLDALMQGSAIVARTMHRATEETLRPLGAVIEQRRQARDGEQRLTPATGSAARRAGTVADVMSKQVRLISPDDTVQQAARLMREQDVGALPVGEGDKLVGMVTDRDVAMRLVAEGRDPARTKVREVMTPDVRYVFEDDELGRAAENMAEQQVRRLPVVNRDKRLVGVVSLGDLALNGNQRWLAGRALAEVVRDTGQHAQAAAE